MTREHKIRQIGLTIQDFYQSKGVSSDLTETILYSVEAGGKRIRPLLLLELLEGFGLELTPAHFQVAAALEMIHTGSLIHDDLPAMDNDDYRRGRLTSHKKFGEDMAILAGDSLFLDPYGLVAMAELPSQVKVELIAELSLAAGSFGMVAGQVLDMQGEGRKLTMDQLQTIHANKTGKLLAYPFVAAGIIAQTGQSVLGKLRQAGELLGLAFQVRDDILDVTASFEKSTYPALLGLDGARAFFDETLEQAKILLEQLEKESDFSAKEIQKIIESLRLDG